MSEWNSRLHSLFLLSPLAGPPPISHVPSLLCDVPSFLQPRVWTDCCCFRICTMYLLPLSPEQRWAPGRYVTVRWARTLVFESLDDSGTLPPGILELFWTSSFRPDGRFCSLWTSVFCLQTLMCVRVCVCFNFSFFYFKEFFFFLLWPLLKSYWVCSSVLLFYVLGFCSPGMWDLGLLARDQIRTPSIGRQNLNHRTNREVPLDVVKIIFLQSVKSFIQTNKSRNVFWVQWGDRGVRKMTSAL